jgi:DNA (cytosine-5)-methyltransferase 1
MAGKGLGRGDTPFVLQALDLIEIGFDPGVVVGTLYGQCADDRTALVLEPLRWALELRPETTCWEQVPAVLPLWERCAQILRAAGYSAWAGILNAEQYGVPQTRRRAVLIASRVRAVDAPTPTHSRYYPTAPTRLDDGVFPWVSMADALGWDPDDLVGFPRRADGQDAVQIGDGSYRARDLRRAALPAFALTEKARSWHRYPADHWAFHRPATTVQGDPRIWPPGHKVNADDRRRLGADAADERYGDRAGTKAIRVTVDEAAALQTFPLAWVYRNGNQAHAARRHLDQPAPTVHFGARANKVEWIEADRADDVAASGVRVTVEEGAVFQAFPAGYPWRGTRTSQYRQVGDAVPPLLGVHVIAAAEGLALPWVAEEGVA